ncbi:MULTISPECIES: hypothetical protein [Streptosporangium]|uniref:Uncharacterized protein n=1 Tax=Streptosporangium brasiliense TaxID=47480 RepID=A0ABT9R113_9ACTN|nr:hypothetical protein [Streptosporangium brasiliense]MDP9862923.1 hypothetical protein [Streptosporangium brasiliense]
MKRWIILVAGALILSTTAAPAHARTAPTDPVTALKAQFVAQRGVKIVESGRTNSDGKPLSAQKRRGVVQFGASGVAGYDILTRSDLPGEKATPVRNLAVGGNVYMSGGVIGESLPEGRKWMRTPGKIRDLSPFLTPVLVLEPATLKALLSTSTVKKPGATLHKGVITFGALYRVSPSYRADLRKRPNAKVAAMKVAWRLWTGRDGLPSRLVTSWAEPPLSMGVTRVSDVRFASWGTPVHLVAPQEETATE